MREWLKNLRTEKKYTQKELGAKLGISESYYCAIENGERQKNMDMLIVSGLSAAFGVSVARIVQMENDHRAKVENGETKNSWRCRD